MNPFRNKSAFSGKIVASIVAIVASVLSITSAFGYYSYVRSPLRFDSYVTNTWSHGYLYGERALDLASSGTAVYSYLQNPNSTDYLYYEISDYQEYGAACPGSKFKLYDHTPGGQYYLYGTINYVHLTDHTGKWGRSWNISPGQYENDLYVGWTTASCGAPVHLHTGHLENDGMSENITGYVDQSVPQETLLMYH